MRIHLSFFISAVFFTLVIVYYIIYGYIHFLLSSLYVLGLEPLQWNYVVCWCSVEGEVNNCIGFCAFKRKHLRIFC